MKKTLAFLLTIALALGATTSLVACTPDNDDTPKSAVCFVIANSANSAGLNFQSSLVQDTVYNTALHYGHLSVVQADGEPKLTFSQSFDIDEKYKSASKERLTADAKQKSAAVLNVLKSTVAKEPESDYIKSLSIAAKSLSSLNGDYTSRTIIILGTGLSTQGVLNFQKNLFSAEPEVIVDMLEEAKEIPSFENMTVVFQHLGEVAAPQEELNGKQKEKLKKIYQLLVERGGGTFVFHETPAIEVDNTIVYPYVTPIELPDDEPIEFEKEELETTDDDAFQEPTFLGEHQVAFMPNQANYIKTEQAIKVLEPIAAYLLEHPTVSLLLIGTTAGDVNDQFALTLSSDRAWTVKHSLEQMGVSPERLFAIGLGCSDPWHLDDADSETAAKANRKVVIIDVRNKIAQEILSQQ